MQLYTMGFTKKSADDFFSLIQKNDIEILIDVRLHNNTQLSGFAKGNDLAYFLKNLCNCKYTSEKIFAPEKKMLNDYRTGIISWAEYEKCYRHLYIEREMGKYFINMFADYKNVLLLCSEDVPTFCHRRLLAEYIQQDENNINIIHL